MKSRWLWLLLILSVLIAFASIFIPAWIIQPFKLQTSQGVQYSYLLRSWSPLITAILFCVSLLTAILLWRRKPRWRAKSAVVLVVLISGFSAWFARQNHFEWMFNPLSNDQYASVSEADFVAPVDMVLAINIQGEAVAYPVRLLAYHHLVNDVAGGKPVVATY